MTIDENEILRANVLYHTRMADEYHKQPHYKPEKRKDFVT